jgi:4-nitrophenyl phosphatase
MLPKVVALDLDGVLWRADTPIPGSVDAVASLRAAGVHVAFVTNNAGPTIADHEAKLEAFGVPAAGDVLTSPMAAASLLRPGERVLVGGGAGIIEAVETAGAVPVTYDEADAGAPVDAVVVGFHREFDWDRMRIASTAVRDGGARFIATNTDATYPTESGLVPGAGSIVAGVATAAGVAPVVAGKPHAPMAELLVDRFGVDGVVVGDRADTDGALARACGWRFALVLSGVTSAADLPTDPVPDLLAPDLAALAQELGAWA